MTFRLPRRVKVGARTLSVRAAKRVTRGNDADGLYDPAAGAIIIRAGLKPERRLQVMIEECLHAIECDRSLDLEHRDVEQLALGLAALIVDNHGGL